LSENIAECVLGEIRGGGDDKKRLIVSEMENPLEAAASPSLIPGFAAGCHRQSYVANSQKTIRFMRAPLGHLGLNLYLQCLQQVCPHMIKKRMNCSGLICAGDSVRSRISHFWRVCEVSTTSVEH